MPAVVSFTCYRDTREKPPDGSNIDSYELSPYIHWTFTLDNGETVSE